MTRGLIFYEKDKDRKVKIFRTKDHTYEFEFINFRNISSSQSGGFESSEDLLVIKSVLLKINKR